MLREDFAILKNDTDNKKLHRVNRFWDHENSGEKWRIWKKLDDEDNTPLKA